MYSTNNEGKSVVAERFNLILMLNTVLILMKKTQNFKLVIT